MWEYGALLLAQDAVEWVLGLMSPRQRTVVGGLVTLVGVGMMVNTLTTCPAAVCWATWVGLLGAPTATVGVALVVTGYGHMQASPVSSTYAND